MTSSTLPRNLWPIRDAAIRHALTGAAVPPNLHLLQEWLEGDGWDALIDAWNEDEATCVNLKHLAYGEFSDAALKNSLWFVCREPFSEDVTDAVISDEIRMQYVRDLIDRYLFDPENSASVHAYRLNQDSVESPVLGYTLTSGGQAGPYPEFLGVFASRRHFIDHLKTTGYCLKEDIAALDNSAVLAMWGYPDQA
jgi:hypothetical protein